MKCAKCAALCFVGLLTFTSGARLNDPSPVKRVVNLLENLKSKIVADSDSETQTYNKFACWCQKTSERKAGLVVTGGDDLRSLGQQILKLKGQTATLTQEILILGNKVIQSEDEQESLTAIRSKQNAAYQSESSETSQALAALQMAIKVLAQATTPGAKKADALLQEDSELQGRDAVKAALGLLPTRAAISSKHMSALSEFTTAKHGQKFAPQSATIQGILGDMYATFSSDLEASTMTEGTRNTDFEKLVSSMEQEVIDMKKSKEGKESKKATAESLLADTTASYDDTEGQMKADTAFFDSTKDQCEAKASSWTTRKSMREEELEGINKALEFLTSDEARELFAKSIKPGVETFIQIANEDSNSPAFKAYSAIRTQARKTKSLRLASLAANVRLAKMGHFDAVLKSIDGMVNTLAEEMAADVEKKDQCNNEYQDIASKVADQSWKVEKNEASIDKLAKRIEMRTHEKATTIKDIESVDQEMADMLQTRTAEHKDFQTAKSDDEAAIDLLTKALDALSSFYKKNDVDMGPIQGSVKLIQQPAFEKSKDQAPEAKFSDKGSNKNESKGIVSMLTMIIEDLVDEVKNGVKDEVSTQTEYEKALETAKKLRKSLVDKKVNLETAIAKRNKEKTEENKDMESTIKDKDAELKYKGEIAPDCDWILKNFEARAAARSSEMSGLRSAKEFLAGKAPQALLEQKVTFDDDALSSVKFLGMKQ